MQSTIKAYDEAITIDPQNADAWSDKGAALAILSKYNGALEAFDKAIKINSRKTNAWYNKGLVLQALNRTADANEAFTKAKELGYGSQFLL